MMKVGLTVFAVLLLARLAQAFGTNMTNPANTVDVFTNCVSKGFARQRKTTIEVHLTNTSGPDTDGVHCTADDYLCLFSFASVAGNGQPLGDYTIVLHAEKNGSVLWLKHDLTKDAGGAVSTPPSLKPLSTFEADVVCYKPDPAWVAAHPVFLGLLPPHQCEGLLFGYADEGFAPPTNGIVAREGSTDCP